MSYKAQVVEILLAGPGDVAEERRIIADAIEKWNQNHAHHLALVMRPVMWETDTFPELGDDPQAIINRQLAGRCAAMIAVFATRLGTATPRAASGTAEEIDRFDADGKPVAVYFFDGPANVSRIDTAQLQLLRDYKESLKDRGLYGVYQSIVNLGQQIDRYIVALGYRFAARQQADEPQLVSTKTAFVPTETDMLVIVAVGRLMVETSNKYANSLYLQYEVELSGVSQDDIFESLRVLKGLGLMSGAEEPGFGRWEVTLTSNGLEMWLLNFIQDYDRLQRQIATAIVAEDLRDPVLISQETRIPRTVVEHILQRWADRSLVLLNRLYDGVRIDRFSQEIRQLAEVGESRQRSAESVRLRDSVANSVPRYRTVAEFIGVDMVALSDFGGELGDSIAAELRVDGRTVVQVVAPSERSTWETHTEEQFQSNVRRLAGSHDLLDRRGEVRLVFDPPQSSAQKQDQTAGELVERP